MELKAKKVMSFLALLLLAANAGATTLSFGCITGNDPSGLSCDIAESQMGLNVESTGDAQVLFTFSNTGPIDSFISDVYFMYTGLDFLVFNSILNPNSGVSFSQGAQPSHLPGYDSTVASFSADSDSGGHHGRKEKSHKEKSHKEKSHKEAGHGIGRNQNGINPGESLGILFDLEDAIYDDVLAALFSGDLVIGIHAQGLGEHHGFSESLIAHPPAVVPLPAAVWLLGSGLLVLFGFMKRSS